MKIRCHECGMNCGTNHDDKLVYRAYVICHDCMAKVPFKVWAAMINSIHGAGSKRYIETPDDELPPEPKPVFEAPAPEELKQFELDEE